MNKPMCRTCPWLKKTLANTEACIRFPKHETIERPDHYYCGEHPDMQKLIKEIDDASS